jgi:hypothetical protein
MILQLIFHCAKKFHEWDFNKQHLDAFVRNGYLSQVEIDQISTIDLQDRFKHNENCPVSFVEIQADDPSCTCLHSPYKNITDKWTMFNAFQYVMYNRPTKSNKTNHSSISQQHYYLFLYQIVLTRILMIVEFDWDLAQLDRYKQYIYLTIETLFSTTLIVYFR